MRYKVGSCTRRCGGFGEGEIWREGIQSQRLIHFGSSVVYVGRLDGKGAVERIRLLKGSNVKAKRTKADMESLVMVTAKAALA